MYRSEMRVVAEENRRGQLLDAARSTVGYESHQKLWEKYSTVRSRPRRLVNKEESHQDFFPRAKQLISVHPIVQERGEEALRFILFQTMNRFMNDIAVLEIETVNKGALMIAGNQFEFCDFPSALRHDALSIIVDEAYHAYVAIDFLRQVEDIVDFSLLPLPKETTVANAISTVKAKLPIHQQDAFELIAVCIGEHVLTKELITIRSEQAVSPSFKAVMADHVVDEGRHAKMFAYVLQYFWQAMPTDYQANIGVLLPEFLREYLRKDIEINFNKQILKALNFSNDEVEQIISDTFVATCDQGMNESNPVVTNLLNLLQRCHILDHPQTLQAFRAYQLAN